MHSQGIDCLIVTGNSGCHGAFAADMRYITGLVGTATDATCLLFPLEADPVFLGPSRFMVARIQKSCAVPAQPVSFKPGTRIRDYASDLVRRIIHLGLQASCIGIVSMRVMPAETYVEIQKELPKARFVPAGDLLLECRSVKSSEELEFTRRAARCADTGMESLVAAAQPGISESELTARCDFAMIRAGADRGPFILLGADPWDRFHGTIGDASRSRKKLRKGDIILTELSPSYGGCYAQLCLPIFVGRKPPGEFLELLEIHKQIYALALAELRPGNSLRTIEEKIAHFAMSKGDFQRAWALQSVELAEAFYKRDVQLRQNMCYVNHPWTEFSSGKGFEGHTVGNTVIITGGAPEPLSRLPLDLITTEGQAT